MTEYDHPTAEDPRRVSSESRAALTTPLTVDRFMSRNIRRVAVSRSARMFRSRQCPALAANHANAKTTTTTLTAYACHRVLTQAPYRTKKLARSRRYVVSNFVIQRGRQGFRQVAGYRAASKAVGCHAAFRSLSATARRQPSTAPHGVDAVRRPRTAGFARTSHARVDSSTVGRRTSQEPRAVSVSHTAHAAPRRLSTRRRQAASRWRRGRSRPTPLAPPRRDAAR